MEGAPLKQGVRTKAVSPGDGMRGEGEESKEERRESRLIRRAPVCVRGGHAVIRKGREIQKKKVEIPLGQMSGGGFFQRKKLQDLNRAISFILLCKALGAEVFKKTES